MIPITQGTVPQTEDQLEEEDCKEAGGSQRSEALTQKMCTYLLSDMEAFKAANPQCVFADFIRWYSPRDWIEEESGEVDEFGQIKGICFIFPLVSKKYVTYVTYFMARFNHLSLSLPQHYFMPPFESRTSRPPTGLFKEKEMCSE